MYFWKISEYLSFYFLNIVKNFIFFLEIMFEVLVLFVRFFLYFSNVFFFFFIRRRRRVGVY